MGIKIPPQIAVALNDDRLAVGAVFFMMVYETTLPKKKFFVVVGFTDDKLVLGNVYINSEINPNKFPTAELQALHLPLTVQDCPFLQWDSYVDCSDIYSKKVAELELLLQGSGTSPFVGSLPDNKLQAVLQLLQDAITIPAAKKRKFGII